MAKSKDAITGLGFNWELLCFQTSYEHWMTLIQEKSKFKQFSRGKSCALYITLDCIFEGKTATGSQAYLSFQSPLPSKQRPRGSFSTKHEKEKGKAHISLNFEDEEVYTPSYVEEPIYISKKAYKRPGSSLDNSSQEGSGSTKSARSSGDPFIECATNMSRLSAMHIEEKQARCRWMKSTLVKKPWQLLTRLERSCQMLIGWPTSSSITDFISEKLYFCRNIMAGPLHVLNNVSGRYDSSDEDDELMELATVVLFGSGTRMHSSPPLRIPCRTSALNGRAWVDEILHGHFARITKNCRIIVDMFMKLCDILVGYGFVSQNPKK
ncbi:hypothetical protein ACH5RR_014762 [Cinchona calisaya]|uniref:Uncharacterized protein n=1 Tax=Cinchona calisaya TaxID=153742 RepID=A0ABD2ZWG7_9GENT